MKKTSALLLLLPSLLSAQPSIQSPEQVFGFQMGADRKLIDWQQIVSYFKVVDEKSDRVIVQEVGLSTREKPFIMAIISSERNIQNLDRYKWIQRELAKPYALSAEAAQSLVAEGKTVVLATLNIHSTEIGSSQESVELLYEFATSNSPKVQKIIDSVIFLLIPSLNPDGQQLVVDWYKKTLGTAAEGSAPPELYHYYAGHDNNRDWFMYNLVESRHTAKVLYHEWFPEIVYDQHQMGANGPRLFLPPYEDPVNPNVPPLLTAQINLLGNYIVTEMHRQGFKGVATGTMFNAFFEGTMSKTPLWHNRIGVLSEAASVHVATPLHFPKGSVHGAGLQLPENKAQTNFLAPWEGGWWRLRDIIEYEKAVTYSLLEFAATFKETIKSNFYRLNREAIEKGKAEAPFGYFVAADQHDPSAAAEMVNRLITAGVEVVQLTQPASLRNRIVPSGSYYVSLAQPARSYVKDLLEVQKYPNLKQYPGGPPRRPYDVTAWTLPMQMGVDVVEQNDSLLVAAAPIQRAVVSAQVSATAKGYYIVERRYTNAYGLVHALLKRNIPVFESALALSSGGRWSLSPGTFVVPVGKVNHSLLEEISRDWQVPVLAHEPAAELSFRILAPARVGIYQPWRTSMDEGWTRYVMDQFRIDYQVLHNADFRKKGVDLKKNLDVLILPDMSTSAIVDGKEQRGEQAQQPEEPVLGTPERPQEYQGGIGKEGVDVILEFLKAGGTLLAFAGASDFAIEKLRVPAVNELKGMPSKDFYAPGSIFEVNINTQPLLAYGMRERAFVYFTNNQAFRLLPYTRESKIIASYGDANPRRSGWLLGAERLAEKVAMAEIPVEKGRVVLYGFRVQHRGQSWGTYKLFLNALLLTR